MTFIYHHRHSDQPPSGTWTWSGPSGPIQSSARPPRAQSTRTRPCSSACTCRRPTKAVTSQWFREAIRMYQVTLVQLISLPTQPTKSPAQPPQPHDRRRAPRTPPHPPRETSPHTPPPPPRRRRPLCARLAGERARWLIGARFSWQTIDRSIARGGGGRARRENTLPRNARRARFAARQRRGARGHGTRRRTTHGSSWIIAPPRGMKIALLRPAGEMAHFNHDITTGQACINSTWHWPEPWMPMSTVVMRSAASCARRRWQFHLSG